MRAKSAAQNILHFTAETAEGIYGRASLYNIQSCSGKSKETSTIPVQVISEAHKENQAKI